jgi:DNA repair exonuclease SbcCD ATPase subunit
MNVTLNLNPKEYQDLIKYCEINELTIDDIVKKSYLEGFMIEKYGLLGGAGRTKEVEVIKEVIKYVEVPVVEEKEVIKIEYVEVEKIVEVIKEVPVTNLDNICDNTQENELLLKIQQLESDKQVFSTKLQECNGEVQKFSTKTTEMENIFQNKMSKKEQELDELRQEIDKQLDKTPVEKIVEVVVEKESTDNSLKPKLDALQTTLAKVRQETLEKDKKIRELEQTIQEIQKIQENKQAIYFNGSNLNNKLNN